jgi:hypothetical protein
MLARLDNGLAQLQGFYVSDQGVLDIAQQWESAHGLALSPTERALVRHALLELDGGFPIGRLYDAFRGRISHRQLVKLGQVWESRGWLTPPPSATEPRSVTDALERAYQSCSDPT